ncbi:MAG: GAF domain-containing protein [Anaerolineae bacterium]
MKGLQALSTQLLAASSVESLWEITLTEAAHWCAADAGAWIWTTQAGSPAPAVGPVYGAVSFDGSAWRDALGQLDHPQEAQCWSPTPLVSHAALSIPVSVETWNGWLVLVRQTPFTEADLERVSAAVALAQFAVAGMGRYERVDQTRAHQVQELETVQRMGHLIGESLNLESTLDMILESLAGLIPYDAGEITLFDAEAGVLRSHAYRSNDTARCAAQIKGTAYRLDEGLSGWLARSREPLLIADVLAEEVTEPKDETLKLWARSFLGVPLLARGQLVGTLEIAAAQPAQFTAHHLRLAEIFGGQAAIAIENARLYSQTDAELRRRLEALEALQRITRDITATIDLNYILNGVLEEAIRFSEATAGLIVLSDGESFELRARRGYVDAELADLERSLGSEFLMRQETIYIPDVQQLPNADSFPPGARALLVEPVFYEERLAAAILVQSDQPAAFSPAVLEFIAGLAVQTSIAVGNTRRYQEQLERGELMHKRAEQMALLLEVSRTMRSDRPLEETLLDIAYAVQEGTGFNIVLISVVEGTTLRRVAGAGIPLARLEQMKQVRHSWPRIQALFQERFRLGRCYYIPAEYSDSVLSGLDVFVPESEEPVTREPGMWHPKDSFITPLYGSHGEIVGMMSVDDPLDRRVPTALTAEVIEVFAAQVALAIENNHLVEDLRRQLNTLRLFNELSRSITTKLDLPLVLNTVVQSVTNLLGYDYATIFLQTKAGQRFLPLATSGYALDLVDEKAFEQRVSRVVQTGMPLVVENAVADPRYKAGPVSIGSSLMVPLMVEGRSVGVLAADRKTAGDFTPTEVATLTALADQVAVAVENARLFEEVTRFNEELELRVAERTRELAEALEGLRLQRDRSNVLYHIASELVASLDMDRVLSQALSMLQKAVKASRSAVILLDNNTGQLFYRAAIGHTEPIPPGGRLAPFNRQDGVIGWVFTHKQALIIPNALQDKRCAVGIDRTIRSVLAAPIVGGAGESLGVILLQSPAENVFDEPELRLVEAAAVQLGNALNNAELYRLIREQAERVGSMLRAQQIEAAKNQAILEGIADGVMVADEHGKVILFNAAAERILSITREQALGRPQDGILGLYGSAAREWLAQIEQWRQNPRAYGAEEFLVHRMEVGRRFVSVHLSPVISPGQEFLGVVSVFRDITSEVEADRAKSDFVSTVSHELRTPMTSIVGYVDLILMGATGPLSDMQRDFLKRVKTNAERLTTLVNDLLDISRIETGRVVLQMAPVAIEDIIKQVVDLLHPKVEEKEQRLYTVLPADLPRVYGDRDRLAQILTNIVGNAYKYTPVGGEIGIHAYVRDAKMHVAVSDTGIGIAPENQKKLFSRFYRVEDDPAVYEVSGTGLGLAISLSLIQMHGGNISLDSVLGKGSTFTFSVPLAEGEPTADIGTPPPRIAGEPLATVLVVEDDRESSDLIKLMLQREDIEFLTASSGEQALHIAREKHPDLITLDIRLPDLDGFEVLQLLKRDVETADIPVVIVSVTQDRQRGLRMGATEFLVKPLDEQRLREVILPLLDRRETVVVAGHDRRWLDPLRAALHLRGLNVRTARRGERALDLVHTTHPAAVVVDQQLPDMDGYQVVESLRRDASLAGVPVMLLTGDALQEEPSWDGGDGAGPVKLIVKPFSIEELAVSIASLIHGNGVLKES